MRGRRILYDGTVQPWEVGWTFIQMLALALASRGNAVFYVDTPLSLARVRRDTLRRLRPHAEPGPAPGLTLFRSTTIPAQRTERLWWLAASLTARRAARTGFRPDLVWAYAPYALTLLDRFPRVPSVYWTGDHARLLPREDELYRRVDAILCVARPVADRLRADYGEKVHFTPVAVDFDRFDAARREGAVDPQLEGLPRPIAGYAGSVNRRLDVPLLLDLARRLDGTLVIAGPEQLTAEQTAALDAEPNVVRLGPQPPERLAPLMLGFDLALIPCVEDEFNLNCNPVKFYEYAALGLPVATTWIPTLKEFDGPASVGPRETFVDRALALLNRREHDVEARVAVARDHSFDALLDRLERIPLP
jgi:glycosyltransferase involved in cell wall biosynthesis